MQCLVRPQSGEDRLGCIKHSHRADTYNPTFGTSICSSNHKLMKKKSAISDDGLFYSSNLLREWGAKRGQMHSVSVPPLFTRRICSLFLQMLPEMWCWQDLPPSGNSHLGSLEMMASPAGGVCTRQRVLGPTYIGTGTLALRTHPATFTPKLFFGNSASP